MYLRGSFQLCFRYVTQNYSLSRDHSLDRHHADTRITQDMIRKLLNYFNPSVSHIKHRTICFDKQLEYTYIPFLVVFKINNTSVSNRRQHSLLTHFDHATTSIHKPRESYASLCHSSKFRMGKPT